MTGSPTAATGGKRTRVRLQIFGILWILVLLNFIDRATLSIAMPFISEEFDLGPEMQGWLLGSFFWTYMLFQIPGGWLLDRFGPRRIVGWAGAVWGGFQLLGGLAMNGIFLTGTRLGLGATEAPVFPAAAKLNSRWLPSRERARGATFVDAAGPFGSAVGGIIVTALIGWTGGWRWAFIITGALTIVTAVVYAMYLRDTPEEHPRVNEAELAHIRSDADVADEAASGPLPRVASYLRSTSFWSLMLGRLGWATVWWGIISWTPSYLSSAMGFDLAGLGWGTFAVYGMGVLGQLVAGTATDTFRARTTNYNSVMKTILAISGIGTVASILALPAISNGYVAIVALGLAVFFVQFGGIYWAFPAWLAPKKQVGVVGGVMNVASSVGGGIAPVVMGYAIAASGGSYAGSFLFLAVAGAVYLVGSMLINFNRPLAMEAPSATGVRA
ncbi:MFS transporter [Mycetocola reblochoni]|uniref:Hexuronate transporter n=2 Tax=Mycetocola reblochoni TaxID=331618 RepID=A0A1R4KAJ8_9MICO|nr:MFS transporter [Mycetocola reblochoni]RLP71182.1 MFS transporter [Mycetocola reblochoni]SJN41162.1 Hexuronate transporter [Mycetocola reblochoni REB411]